MQFSGKLPPQHKAVNPYLLHPFIYVSRTHKSVCSVDFQWVTRLVVVFLVLVNSPFVTCQQMSSLLEQPALLPDNTLSFGLDKIANTYLWLGSADVRYNLESAQIRVLNNYRGAAFRTSTLATRDDQSLNVQGSYTLAEPLTFLVRHSWILSNDSRSTGLSSLSRLNGAAGFAYTPSQNVRLEALSGLENSTQLGINATGPIVVFQGSVSNFELEQWRFTGSAIADWQKVDVQRENSDVALRAEIARYLDDGTQLNFYANYGSLSRQYFTTVSSTEPNAVEQRSEKRLEIRAALGYPLSQTLTINAEAAVSANDINRQYGSVIPTAVVTSVDRTLSEFLYSVQGALVYTVPKLRLEAGGNFYNRSEENGVNERFSLLESDLLAIRQQEFQRDNQTAQSKMFSMLRYTPSEVDTISGDVSGWLLRYDTPSNQNNDDRDELTTVASLSYARSISSILSAKITLAGQYTHLVFLKASRSALNNVNRVIRLAPSLVIHGSVVRMQPQAEVLANYTVYDYEERGASVRSFSFRQLSLRDSITVVISDVLHTETQLLLRYFERSALNWKSFTETPQAGNIEYLVKMLLHTTPSRNITVGAGIRLYALEQKSLNMAAGATGLLNAVQFWAPETSVRFTTTNNSLLTLSGWYEFQTVRTATDTRKRDLPNLLLQARITL